MPRAICLLCIVLLAGCQTVGRQSAQNDVLSSAAAIRAGTLSGSDNDVASYLAEDVTISHRGVTQSREEYLNSIRSGDIRYTSIDESDQRVRMYGNVAIVTGKRSLNLTWGGRKFSPKLQFTAVYVHRDGNWLLAAYHSDELRPPATAPTTTPTKP